MPRPLEVCAVSQPMNIAPELLIVAGVEVTAHSQDLVTIGHRADAMVDSALPGWVGRSAAALAARAATWADATLALSARVYVHGEALRRSGLNFAEMECRGAQTVVQVHPTVGSP
ncbi:MAG: hypothetical protein ACOYO2_06440 [Mycobacterium sp.]